MRITYIPRPRRPWPSAWGAHAAAGGTGGGGGRPRESFPDLRRIKKGRLTDLVGKKLYEFLSDHRGSNPEMLLIYINMAQISDTVLAG